MKFCKLILIFVTISLLLLSNAMAAETASNPSVALPMETATAEESGSLSEAIHENKLEQMKHAAETIKEGIKNTTGIDGATCIDSSFGIKKPTLPSVPSLDSIMGSLQKVACSALNGVMKAGNKRLDSMVKDMSNGIIDMNLGRSGPLYSARPEKAIPNTARLGNLDSYLRR